MSWFSNKSKTLEEIETELRAELETKGLTIPEAQIVETAQIRFNNQ